MENATLTKVAVNKSLLKEYKNSGERIVYLNNGDEFQIQLFNPYTYVIGADISINGKQLSNRLIIRPGERVWLERFFDSPDKFKFSTYKVNGNNSEVQKAIQNNGLIEISFYKEQQTCYTITKTWNPIPLPNQPLYNNYEVTCGDMSSVNYCGTLDCNLSLTADCSTALTGASAATCTSTATSYSVDSIQYGTNSCANKSKERSMPKSIETGRIEKGSHSNQSFEHLNIDFEYWSFKTETIKILPKSQKQYTSEDLEKKYCYNCGRKIKNKFKFCPFCGAEQ